MIGIIFTGGTIGSTAGERYITTDSKKSYRLIEMYREQYGDDVEFNTVIEAAKFIDMVD